MYDTVKGSDWLGDQDAIEYMCRNAISCGRRFSRAFRRAVLAHRGRADYQRPFGGHMRDYGEAIRRGAPALPPTDRHAIIHALPAMPYATTRILVEYFARPEIMDDEGACRGHRRGTSRTAQCIAFAPLSWSRHRRLRPDLFLLGPRHTCTGDGSNAWAARAGLALQDMEFIQFIDRIWRGRLITEGARRRRLYDQQRGRAVHGAPRHA
jgi:succinate dehydrogenase / fumarate reductase flavoprotein subunit